jgi:hypothetical protein
VLLGSPLLAQDVRTPTVQPGTYRLVICAEPCATADTARSAATAIVVLIDTSDTTKRAAFDAVSLPAIDRPRGVTAEPNACFKVTQAARTVGTESLLFGIIKNAKTYAVATTTPGGSAFSMRFFKSIDAAYELRWTGSGQLTRGEGWSVSASMENRFHRNAYFEAERIGEPDPARCK